MIESPTGDLPYDQVGGDIPGESISLTMPLHLRFGARYILRACNGGGCSDSAPVEVVDSMANAIGYFKASNTEAGDVFGYIDVELSADGNTLAVGSRREDSAATGIGGDQADNTASLAGAVYVFVRANNVWSQQAYIKASNTEAVDLFGYCLALSSDGNTLAVGALSEDSAATGIDADQA
ncbi:MAG: histidine kinase, partial [Nannocystis sp.]